MESNPKFEIIGDNGPIIKVVGDSGEVTEISTENLPPPENPRFRYVGEYDVCDHPNYKPTSVFRDMKWLFAYDKQATKYPKRFKQRTAA